MSIFDPATPPPDSEVRDYASERLQSGYEASEVLEDLAKRGLSPTAAIALIHDLGPDLSAELLASGQAAATKWVLPFVVGVAFVVHALTVETFPRLYTIPIAAALYGGYRTINGIADIRNGRRLRLGRPRSSWTLKRRR